MRLCGEGLKAAIQEQKGDGQGLRPNGEHSFMKTVAESLIPQDGNNTMAHPKLLELENILRGYFDSSWRDDAEDSANRRSRRVIVFANNRIVVEDIVAHLKSRCTFLCVAAFVGQGSGKCGRKQGLRQSDQMKVHSMLAFSACSSRTDISRLLTLGVESLRRGSL